MSKALYPFAAVILAMCVVLLSGCSATSALDSLIGDKPDVTAQVGAENTKQLAGVTAKQDASTKQETTVKESQIGKMDSSSRKQVKAATVQANEIKAESITVNGSDPLDDLPILAFSGMCLFIAGFLTGKLTNKKEA